MVQLLWNKTDWGQNYLILWAKYTAFSIPPSRLMEIEYFDSKIVDDSVIAQLNELKDLIKSHLKNLSDQNV